MIKLEIVDMYWYTASFKIWFSKIKDFGNLELFTRVICSLIDTKTKCLLNISQQGSHRYEKYLNIQDCLEKSLK